MARKEDESRVRLQVDGKQAINELGKLEMEAKELKIDINNATKGTKEYINANKKLDEVKAKMTGLRKELGLAGMTMGQLSRYQRELRKEINATATQGTAEYKRLQAQFRAVNDELRKQRAELNGTKGFWADMGKQLKQFGVLALSALGATAIFAQMQSMVEGAARLSDAFADVQKTTGLTGEELDKLNKRLKALNTRTPRSELLALAEIAGRLGITGVKDIEGFVRAADKINVALGDALGDPEAVMRELGKLTETFNIKEAYGIEDSLLKLGSAINELGMASTANEGYMVEFAKRLGGIAPLAGISIENVLGLGATLDSLGQTAEVSTTALSKLFIDMAKNAEQYAKFAKMKVADFVQLMNTDANEAFLRMLEGVKDNSEGITELADTLGDLGQDGGRVVGVLGILANNIQKIREQQLIANEAFRDGTSINKEYSIINENMAANLEKVQKWLAGAFVNSAIMEGIGHFVRLWADWVSIPVSETMEAERIELNKTYLEITSLNTSTEDRIKLIKELQAKYPSLLGNLNAERVSNKNLATAVKAVNDQLINKIILEEEDEALQKKRETAARVRKQLYEEENALKEEMIRVSEKYELKIFEGLSREDQARTLLERAEKFDDTRQGRHGQRMGETAKLIELLARYRITQAAVNDLDEETMEMAAKRDALAKRLGLEMVDPQTVIPDGPGNDLSEDDPSAVPGDPEKAKKKLEELAKLWEAYQQKIRDVARKYKLSQMEAEQREKGRVTDQYKELEKELERHKDTKAISETEYTERLKDIHDLRDKEIAAIEKKYLDQRNKEREAAEQVLMETTMSEQELAKLRINQHYDERLELARKYGDDMESIEEGRLKALAELEDHYQKQQRDKAKEDARKKLQEEVNLRQAQISVISEYANIAAAAIDLVGKKSGEMTTFQKILALAQIGIDTGAAIMKAELVALQAAAAGGPAAPFIYKATKLSVVGSILTAASRAKALFSESSVPAYTANSTEEITPPRAATAPVSSYYMGGDTGGGSLGFGDRYGDFAGFVHRNEYVVPSFIRSHPFVADVMPAIEAIRQERVRGFYRGGETAQTESSSSKTTSADTNWTAMLKELIHLQKEGNSMLAKMPTRLKAYLVDSEWQEFREERDTLEERYRG